MEHMKAPAASGYGDCPICHGTGWELFFADVLGYGETEFARRCTHCAEDRRGQDHTGVPEEYRDAGLDRFDFTAYTNDMGKLQQICNSFFRDFKGWEREGKGFYFWSKTPGSGKTFLACCLAKSVMVRYNLTMRFATAIDYINLVGDSYRRERGAYDPSEIYRNCQVLVLDDIGAQADKEWQRQELFRLINRRMELGNITIFTSNLPAEQLNVDERTKDRIIKCSVVLQMPEESIRRKKAAKEQANFLQKISC